jgi:hypothetical protein
VGALEYQRAGTDLLLAGQTPLGEVLAAPSAPLLEAISACLIDCDDDARIARPRARGSQWRTGTGGTLQDYLNWAAWMRRHAADPTWRIDVIRLPATEGHMRWDRWSCWKAGDPRWGVWVIDTSALPVEHVAERLVLWIDAERGLFRAGTDPLSHWRTDDKSPAQV